MLGSELVWEKEAVVFSVLRKGKLLSAGRTVSAGHSWDHGVSNVLNIIGLFQMEKKKLILGATKAWSITPVFKKNKLK